MIHSDHGMWRRLRGLVQCLAVAAVAAGLLALPGCPPKVDDRDLVMVGPDEAMKAMSSRGGVLGIGKGKAVWVDPRSIEAYRKGHIPGAIHLPFANLEEDHEALLEGASTIVVYGDDYNDAKAMAMSKRLLELKYSDVRTLTGGLRQWKSQGYELETGDPPAAQGDSK